MNSDNENLSKNIFLRRLTRIYMMMNADKAGIPQAICVYLFCHLRSKILIKVFLR